ESGSKWGGAIDQCDLTEASDTHKGLPDSDRQGVDRVGLQKADVLPAISCMAVHVFDQVICAIRRGREVALGGRRKERVGYVLEINAAISGGCPIRADVWSEGIAARC